MKKKYCKECGKQGKPQNDWIEYDENTGKPKYIGYMCPDYTKHSDHMFASVNIKTGRRQQGW